MLQNSIEIINDNFVIFEEKEGIGIKCRINSSKVMRSAKVWPK
jgi:hypothetical protein